MSCCIPLNLSRASTCILFFPAFIQGYASQKGTFPAPRLPIPYLFNIKYLQPRGGAPGDPPYMYWGGSQPIINPGGIFIYIFTQIHNPPTPKVD